MWELNEVIDFIQKLLSRWAVKAGGLGEEVHRNKPFCHARQLQCAVSTSDIPTAALIQVPRIKGPVKMTKAAKSRIQNVSVIESAIGFFLFLCQDTDGYFAIRGVNNPELYLQKALDYDKFNSTTLLLFARVSGLGGTERFLLPEGWDISGITGGKVGTGGGGCIRSSFSLSLTPVTDLQSAHLYQQDKIA